jgi:hypothetical protein
MVHSSMSPHLFEQSPQISTKTPPASPTKRTPCALPKMEACNPLIPRPMRTLHKTPRGTPPTHPISELHLPRLKKARKLLTTANAQPNMECGAPAPLLTNHTNHQISTAQNLTSRAAHVHLHAPTLNTLFTTHSNPRAIITSRSRFLLDNLKSSANIPILSV